MSASLLVYVMALAWVVGGGMFAVGIAWAVLELEWRLERRRIRRRRGSVVDVDLTGVWF